MTPGSVHAQSRDAFDLTSCEKTLRRLLRISAKPGPDGEHDGACRNSRNQHRRFRTTEGAALESNNALAGEPGAAARDDRIVVDPIDDKRPCSPPEVYTTTVSP